MKSIILLLLLLLAINKSEASAHTLDTSQSITAIMHLDPNDDPIAGKRTEISFDFDDKDGQFTLKNCECQVQLLQNNQIIDTKKLLFRSGENSNRAYADIQFPEIGTYVVLVSGEPKSQAAFAFFEIMYEINVNKKFSSLNETDKRMTPAQLDENNLELPNINENILIKNAPTIITLLSLTIFVILLGIIYKHAKNK